MSGTELSKSTLRELIVDFYATHDAQRLSDGIDVAGMVDWTLDKGLDALNDMLRSSYGAAINPNKKLQSNTPADIQRMSMAISGNIAALNIKSPQNQETFRRLEKFYRKHDPLKIPGLKKLVEYSIYKGMKALNAKLSEKYGEDLDTFTPTVSEPKIQEVSIPDDDEQKQPAPELLVSVMSVRNSSTPGDATDVEEPANEPDPPVPTIDETEHPEPAVRPAPPDFSGERDKEQITKDLEVFYQAHDPGKLDVLEALVSWALQIGRTDFNKKLTQLYGYNLESPPVEKEIKLDPATIIVDKDVEILTNLEANNDEASNSSPQPDTRTLPVRQLNTKVLETGDKVPPSFKNFDEALLKSVKPAKPLQGPKLITNRVEGEACEEYRLDMTGQFFGVCKCGFPKTSHSMW